MYVYVLRYSFFFFFVPLKTCIKHDLRKHTSFLHQFVYILCKYTEPKNKNKFPLQNYFWGCVRVIESFSSFFFFVFFITQLLFPKRSRFSFVKTHVFYDLSTRHLKTTKHETCTNLLLLLFFFRVYADNTK